MHYMYLWAEGREYMGIIKLVMFHVEHVGMDPCCNYTFVYCVSVELTFVAAIS